MNDIIKIDELDSVTDMLESLLDSHVNTHEKFELLLIDTVNNLKEIRKHM